MAPRRLSPGQSGWGVSGEEAPSRGPLLAFAVIILIVGAVLGYLVRGNSSHPGAIPARLQTSNAAVIEPNIEATATADKSITGAVKAATSIVTGLPNLATETTDKAAADIADILVPNADPALVTNLNTSVASLSSQLHGTGNDLTARQFITPVSYKTAQQGNQVTVTIWYSRVFLDSQGGQFGSAWSTATVQLEHSDKWRMSGFSSKDGPTPPLFSLGGTPSTYNDILPVINGGSAYRYALAR